MATYTPPTISNYNDNPAPDDGTEVTDNEITWAKIKDELTDPVYVYSDAINAAVAASMALIGTDAEGTFSNNANGNPNVSDTSFNFTALTINNYETIGPTAAGSTNTWTALDSVPTGVDWIEVAVNCSVTGTATLVSAEALARASGGSSSSSATQFIARTSLGDGTSNAKTSATTSRGVKIPVDSAVEFEGKYTSTAGTPSIILYLTGYGTNP